MAGYCVEALLKCAICKILDADHLPVNFQLHDLEELLFLAGLAKKIQALPETEKNFHYFSALWKSAQLRYEDPNSPSFTVNTCNNVDKWLNDPSDGIVPWLERNI